MANTSKYQSPDFKSHPPSKPKLRLPSAPPNKSQAHLAKAMRHIHDNPSAKIYADVAGHGQGPRFFKHFEYVDNVEVTNAGE